MQEYTLQNVDVHLEQHRAYLIGNTIALSLTYNGGDIHDGMFTITNNDEILFDANEANVKIIPPWEINDIGDPTYERLTLTVIHGSDSAYLLGEANNFPAYTPVHLIDINNHLYRIDYHLGPDQGVYFNDTDIPDSVQYYTITDTGTGLTEGITKDELNELYGEDMRPIIEIR